MSANEVRPGFERGCPKCGAVLTRTNSTSMGHYPGECLERLHTLLVELVDAQDDVDRSRPLWSHDQMLRLHKAHDAAREAVGRRSDLGPTTSPEESCGPCEDGECGVHVKPKPTATCLAGEDRGGYLCSMVGHGIDKDPYAKERRR